MHYCRSGKDDRCRGFSLIEMLVVVAMMGALSSIAILKVGGITKRTELRQIESRIVSDLQRARQHAIQTSTELIVFFSAAQSSYSISGLPERNNSGADEAFDLPASGYSVTFKTVNFDGAEAFRIDQHGMMWNELGTQRMASAILEIELGTDSVVIPIDVVTGQFGEKP